LTYEDFKALVRETGESRVRQGHLIPIPELWNRCRAHVSRAEFEQFLAALDAEGLVHLLSHVDSDSLSDAARTDAVRHPSGALLYWVRWL
jgi:hypothetical protein